MSGGRPRTAIGTYGAVYVMRTADRYTAETRFRDVDGRLRKVTATAGSASAAKALLKERLLNRTGYGSGGQLSLASPFGDLVALWLADLDLRELAEGTKDSYRDQVRLHVLPAFEHFTLGEITTGRVEWLLKSQAAVSHSRAQRSRTMLNLLFGFALRHDAMSRNPVEGTSTLRTPKNPPQALTLEQIAAIREAAANWRTGSSQPGPKPDGQVRDIIEVLLGTAEVGCVDPQDPGSGVRCSGAARSTLWRRSGADHLREPQRRAAEPLQRAAYVPGVPRRRGPGGFGDQPALVPAHRRHRDCPRSRQRRRGGVPWSHLDCDHGGPLHRA